MTKFADFGSQFLFGLILYVSINSYGHVETVSSPRHTFSWASLIKRLTSNLCTNFRFKETRSVTLNIFRKKKNLFKSFVKIELSYVFTINMLIKVENCMEK